MKVRQDPPAANGISGTKGGERPRNHSEISGSYGYGHDRLRGIMILFYGTGGVPGGGEIPMNPIRYRASVDFLFCILGSRKNEMQRRKPQRML